MVASGCKGSSNAAEWLPLAAYKNEFTRKSAGFAQPFQGFPEQPIQRDGPSLSVLRIGSLHGENPMLQVNILPPQFQGFALNSKSRVNPGKNDRPQWLTRGV